MALTKITSTNIQPGAIESSSLETSGATAGTYGAAAKIPVLSVNAQGIVYAISEVDVAGVTGFTYNSGTEALTITTADGGSFTADISTLASQSYVDTALSNLVDTAPTTLDTLNELAAALGDDPNFATTVATSIGTKVDKINITGATVGSASQVPVITFNAQGQITAATTTAVAGVSGTSFTNGTYTISTSDGGTYPTDFDARYFTETEAQANFLGINAKAVDSDLLDGLNSTQFLRSDQDGTLAGNLTLRGFGTGAALHLRTTDNFVGIGFNRDVANGGIFDQGIGAHQIHINSDGRFEHQQYNSSGSFLGYPFLVNTNGNVGLVIDSGANVLIGTNNLDIGGTVTGIRLNSNGAILTSIDGTGFYNTPIYADRRGTNNAGNILSLALNGYWKSSIGVVGTSSPANDGGITFNTISENVTLVERMRINTTGVGIGTQNPQYKLHVLGHTVANVTNTSPTDGAGDARNDGFGFKVATNGADVLGALINSSANGNWGANIHFNVRNSGGGTFPATPAMTIRSDSNNVGIGTTTPAAKLDVNGDISANFFLSDTVINSSYTIPTGKNAMTAGPITVADGVTITVPDGSTWTVV